MTIAARRTIRVRESEAAEREGTANAVGMPVARSDEDERACAPASAPAVSGPAVSDLMLISVEAGVGEGEGDAGTCVLQSSSCSRNVRCTDTN